MMKNLLQLFVDKHKLLYLAAVEFHQSMGLRGVSTRGHSLDHDLAVMAHALMLGESIADNALGEMAAAAALMHSYDCFGLGEEDARRTSKHLEGILPQRQIEQIIRAVLGHDRPNREESTGLLTVVDVLADADKLACLMLYNPVRTGAFDYSLPTIDLNHVDSMTPGANYKRHNVAWDDLHGMLEWVHDLKWFKTEKAKKLATQYGDALRIWMKTSILQFEIIGLGSVPVPS